MLVTPEHCSEELAVVRSFRDALPFPVSRTPDTLAFPAVQVREHLGADPDRREFTDDRESHRPPELVQLLVLKAPPPPGAKTALGKRECVAFAHAPGIEGRLWKQDSE